MPSLDDGATLLLTHELAGREIAAQFGLAVAGTVAVIDMAESRGLAASAQQ